MNLELTEKIVALLGEYPVSEITVETQNSRVHVVKPLSGSLAATVASPPPVPHLEAVAPEAAAGPERVLTAPMVGIFYHRQPPLLLGAEIKPGQTIGSIESMKLMNDVAAEEGGRIAEILAEDGAPVDYGRALFRLTV